MRTTINYTGRSRIPLDAIDLRAGDGEFTIAVDIADKDLPDDAMVVAEAYERTVFERFELGTVAGKREHGPHRLEHVDPELALFRVKVIGGGADEPGRLLAVADRVRPQQGDGDETGASTERVPLLHARPAPLDGELWRLDLSGNWPLLEYEETLVPDGFGQFIGTNPMFRNLVYPAIMRHILTALVLGDEDDVFDEDSWQQGWIDFAASVADRELPETDDRPEWIASAARQFSRELGAVDSMRAHLKGLDTDV